MKNLGKEIKWKYEQNFLWKNNIKIFSKRARISASCHIPENPLAKFHRESGAESRRETTNKSEADSLLARSCHGMGKSVSYCPMGIIYKTGFPLRMGLS